MNSIRELEKSNEEVGRENGSRSKEVETRRRCVYREGSQSGRKFEKQRNDSSLPFSFYFPFR